MTVRIRNAGQRLLHLPSRAGVRGANALEGPSLAAGASIEVPEEYVQELLAERGPANRLSRGELVVEDLPAEAEVPAAEVPAAGAEIPHVLADAAPSPGGAEHRRGRRGRGAPGG